MSETHEHFMRIALEDAAQSGAEGNRAIGSIIVHNGQVVARSGGRPGSSENPMGHAETLAILEAAQVISKAQLAECTQRWSRARCAVAPSSLTTSQG